MHVRKPNINSSYPTKFLNEDDEDEDQAEKVKYAAPNLLSTTFTFKAQRFQYVKYGLSWLAMLFTISMLFPLVSFGALPLGLCVLMIMLLMFG